MDIKKLPVWAQAHIKEIQRQRDIAVRALNEYIDNQTPCPFFIDELESTGEEQGPTLKRRYIQTRKISINHQGVGLNVLLRDDHIDLSWGDENHGLSEIAFIPTSFQQAKLVSKQLMR